MLGDHTGDRVAAHHVGTLPAQLANGSIFLDD